MPEELHAMTKKGRVDPNRKKQPYHIVVGRRIVCGNNKVQILIPLDQTAHYPEATWCERCWEMKDVASLAEVDL